MICNRKRKLYLDMVGQEGGGESVSLWVEAAANSRFGIRYNGDGTGL